MNKHLQIALFFGVLFSVQAISAPTAPATPAAHAPAAHAPAAHAAHAAPAKNHEKQENPVEKYFHSTIPFVKELLQKNPEQKNSIVSEVYDHFFEYALQRRIIKFYLTNVTQQFQFQNLSKVAQYLFEPSFHEDFQNLVGLVSDVTIEEIEDDVEDSVQVYLTEQYKKTFHLDEVSFIEEVSSLSTYRAKQVSQGVEAIVRKTTDKATFISDVTSDVVNATTQVFQALADGKTNNVTKNLDKIAKKINGTEEEEKKSPSLAKKIVKAVKAVVKDSKKAKNVSQNNTAADQNDPVNIVVRLAKRILLRRLQSYYQFPEVNINSFDALKLVAQQIASERFSNQQAQAVAYGFLLLDFKNLYKLYEKIFSSEVNLEFRQTGVEKFAKLKFTDAADIVNKIGTIVQNITLSSVFEVNVVYNTNTQAIKDKKHFREFQDHGGKMEFPLTQKAVVKQLLQHPGQQQQDNSNGVLTQLYIPKNTFIQHHHHNATHNATHNASHNASHKHNGKHHFIQTQVESCCGENHYNATNNATHNATNNVSQHKYIEQNYPQDNFYGRQNLVQTEVESCCGETKNNATQKSKNNATHNNSHKSKNNNATHKSKNNTHHTYIQQNYPQVNYYGRQNLVQTEVESCCGESKNNATHNATHNASHDHHHHAHHFVEQPTLVAKQSQQQYKLRRYQ